MPAPIAAAAAASAAGGAAAGGTAAAAGGTAAAAGAAGGAAAGGTAAAGASGTAGATAARAGSGALKGAGRKAVSGGKNIASKAKGAYDKLPTGVQKGLKRGVRNYAQNKIEDKYQEHQEQKAMKGINPVHDEEGEEEYQNDKQDLKKGCLIGFGGLVGCGCLTSIFVPVFLGALVFLMPYAVVSWLSSVVEVDFEKVSTSTLASCEGCTYDELNAIREHQWKEKLDAIENKYGGKVDKAAIIATAVYNQNLSDVVAAEYTDTKDFKSEDWLGNMAADTFTNLWNLTNGDAGQSFGQYSSNNISLLQYIAEGMASSGASYSDENYKNWLINGGNNSLYCVASKPLNDVRTFFSRVADNMGVATDRFFKELENGRIPFEYFTPKVAGDVIISSTVGSTAYYWNDGFNYLRICNYGYIEGMISGVYNIQDSKRKQLEKERIAQEIIDLAEYYRESDEWEKTEDECTYVGETGDFTSWKQCDSTWGNVSIGNRTICSIGCLATSISMQIARSGTKITNIPSGYSEFNPGAFVTSLNAHGGFVGNGISWTGWSNIVPNFKSGYYVDHSFSQSNESSLASELNKVLNEAEEGKYQRYAILRIHHSKSEQHWIAVEGIEGNKVKVNDPNGDNKTLSEKYNNWVVDGYRIVYATDVPFGKSGSSQSSGSSSKINYTSSSYKERLEKITDYYQCGDKLRNTKLGNSNVCTSGCMVASLSAMQYMFTGTPTDVNSLIADMILEGEWSNAAAGMGTPYFDKPINSPILTKKWGLSGQTLNSSDKNKIKDSIISNLKAGKKILLNLGGGKNTYSTVGGHFLMLDHYDESSKKIYIFNPAKSGTGYITEEQLMSEVLAYNKYGPWAISSSKASSDNACDTGGSGDMDGLIRILGELEGVPETCTVRGKEGYKTYTDSMDQQYAGKTTAYGITQVFNKGLAKSIGYTNFDSDMSNGCAEKSYINEMAKKTMEEGVETVRKSYEAKSGGKSLSEYQYHALAMIHHHWPVGVQRVIDELVKISDKKSYQTYSLFLRYNGLGGAQGGLNRREAEFHLFYNGNYNLERVFDVQNTESYYKKRVAVYESE